MSNMMSAANRSNGLVVGFAIAAVGAFLIARSAALPATSVTDETLLATFDADMRHVVYRWSPDDPRPEGERRRALFDFIYQTYDSSAWIPQSLFDANVVTQAVIGSVDTIVRDKVGLVLWRDNQLVPAFGMAPNRSSLHGPRPVPLANQAGEPLR